MSGNADISVLNKASAIIKSSSSIEGLSAGEYTIQVLPISGDIKYTLNLAELNSPKKADADILTGTKLETASPLAATILPVVSTSEKPTATKDAITGTLVQEKAVTADKIAATDKPATTLPATTTDKPVTTTSTTTEKPATILPATTTSTTTEKPVTATPTTTDKPATTTSTISAVSTTSTTTEKPVTTTSTTTEKPATTTSTTSAVSTTSTTTDKPVTTTSQTITTTTTDKPATTLPVTESAVSTTSTTTDKLVTTTSQTTTDKPATTPPATASAVSTTSTTTDKLVTTTSQTTTLPATTTAAATTAVTKDPITGDTVATQETKTGTPLTADKPVVASLDASKPAEKPNTATSNAEETKKETTTALPATETKKEPEPTTDKKLTSPFTSGIFTTDQTGRISVDYTFDGGFFQGELAIFILEGLEKFEPGSEAFIKEVAGRSLSNSVKGHVVINDATEGARFSGFLGESNVNEGVYLGVKSFAVTAGGKYGVMLVPSGSVKSVFDNPNVGGTQRPLFSMAMANPVQGFNFGQIADITGEGNTFVMEDMRLDAGSDKDYNDIIFQVRGATAKAALLDTVINPDKEWRKTDLGKALIAYAKPYITPEPKLKVDAEVSDLLDDLEKEILKTVTSDKETPKSPSLTPTTGKDADNSKEPVRVSIPPAKTDDKPKDSASNGGDLTKVETSDKVDTKPINALTTGKNTAADSTEKLPVEKTPVPPVATEVKDKVTEAPATETLPVKSATEKEVIATTPTEKVETKPEVLPTESKVKGESKPVVVTEVKDKVTEVAVTGTSPVKSVTDKEVVATIPTQKVETKSEVLPVGTPAKEESKPAVVTEVEKTETPKVAVVKNPVDSTKESQPTATVESQETTEVKPSLPVKQTDLDSMPLTTTNKSEESQTKEIVSDTPAVSEVVIPKESLPILPIVDESTEDDYTTPENPQPSIDVFPTGSEVDYSISANLIARLESMKQSLTNLGSADDPGGNSSNEALIARLESVTQKLMTFNESTPVSDNTVLLIDRLEETVYRLTIPPIEQPLESIDAAQFDFPVGNQPIIGVIDTGFAGNNPDIDYSRITWGQDRVDGDADPRLEPGKGNEHGTHVLGIIAATQNNGVGIDGVNEKAPVWAGRAIGSGKWADSLVEYVDFVKTSGKKNGVINLSMDLTQVNADGTTTTRYELTPEERSAIEYARQNGVLMVVAAGNDGGVMSALGQASQEFDNIITVGAAERINDEIALSKGYDRTNYSSYGQGLDILASGGTVQNPQLSTVGDGVGFMAGTSAATAKVTGAASQVWAANPTLSFRQVIEILKQTATDLKTTDWDSETGGGLLNLESAVALALATIPQEYDVSATLVPETWSGEGKVTPTERASQTIESFRLRV